MKTKEEALRSAAGLIPFARHFCNEEPAASVYKAMEEYAKQTAIDYMHWCFKKVFPSMTPDNTSAEAEQLFDKYFQEKIKYEDDNKALPI